MVPIEHGDQLVADALTIVAFKDRLDKAECRVIIHLLLRRVDAIHVVVSETSSNLIGGHLSLHSLLLFVALDHAFGAYQIRVRIQ